MALTDKYDTYDESKFYSSYNPDESFEVPIVLLLSPKYQKQLTPLSMLLYGVLKHDFPMYLKMKWVDADGHVYYKESLNQIAELAEMFNCSTNEVHEAKLLLVQHGLIAIDCDDWDIKNVRYYLLKPDIK